jgi:hypothetical protein
LDRITSIFLVCRKYPDKSVPFADSTLPGANISRVGQEDFRPGQINTLGHGERDFFKCGHQRRVRMVECYIVQAAFRPVNPHRTLARVGQGASAYYRHRQATPASIAVQQNSARSREERWRRRRATWIGTTWLILATVIAREAQSRSVAGV